MSGEKDDGKKWWEMLDWSKMGNTWWRIQDEKMRQKIREKGIWSLGVEVFEDNTNEEKKEEIE